jgi:hypothetical protein
VICDSLSFDIRDLVNDTEARLPAALRARLEHVRVRDGPPEMKAYADCGAADIRVRLPLPPWSAAARGVLLHEACHILLNHYAAVQSGIKTVAQCEHEAERLLASWNMQEEREARRAFYGR